MSMTFDRHADKQEQRASEAAAAEAERVKRVIYGTGSGIGGYSGSNGDGDAAGAAVLGSDKAPYGLAQIRRDIKTYFIDRFLNDTSSGLSVSWEPPAALANKPGFEDVLNYGPSYWMKWIEDKILPDGFGRNDKGEITIADIAMDSVSGLKTVVSGDGDEIVVNEGGNEIEAQDVIAAETTGDICLLPPAGGSGDTLFPDSVHSGFDAHYDKMEAQLDELKAAYETGIEDPSTRIEWKNLPPQVREKIVEAYLAKHDGVDKETATDLLSKPGGLYEAGAIDSVKAGFESYRKRYITDMRNQKNHDPLNPDELKPASQRSIDFRGATSGNPRMSIPGSEARMSRREDAEPMYCSGVSLTDKNLGL